MLSITPEFMKLMLVLCRLYLPEYKSIYEGVGLVVNEKEHTHYKREFILMENSMGTVRCVHWLELCFGELARAIAEGYSDRYRKMPEVFCNFQSEMLQSMQHSRRHPVQFLYERHEKIMERMALAKEPEYNDYGG